MTDLSHLQDLADEAAQENEPILNFPLSKEQEQQYNENNNEFMTIQNIHNKGKGFIAKQTMQPGTLLLVSKPISLIMGWEEDVFHENDGDINENDDGGGDDEDNMMDDEDLMKSNLRNGVLSVKVAKAIKDNPSLWYNQLTNLFPRDKSSLPIWVCEHAETGMEFERSIDELKEMNEFLLDDVIEDIRQRLPFIVRYNCLSVETAPELFVYPDQSKGGHVSLSATGLYYLPSYFNHSNKPNVSRWCIGDIMFFVTNQEVKIGTELCISYIESELLCENATRRSLILEMDFEDVDDNNGMGSDNNHDDQDQDDDDECEGGPVINLDVQDELINMHPLNRLDEINRLLFKSCNKDGEEMDEDDDEDDLVWFQCDSHRLRTLLALTYEGLGQPTKALEQWKNCVEFAEKNFPPADEAGIVLYVQAALTALSLSEESMAREYAATALSNHKLIFGGGVEFFRRRYAKEMQLQLRSSNNVISGQAVLDKLWPIK